MEKEISPEALVVEDEPMTRMVAADAISEVGVKVHEADNADEALRILNEQPRVSLMFTDIELRGDTNGLVLANEVHAARPEVELIVTSGTNDLVDDDLPDSGTFLAKPYRIDRLQNIVRKKLELGSQPVLTHADGDD
jgi:DNA-binding NtrC family response regulator